MAYRFKVIIDVPTDVIDNESYTSWLSDQMTPEVFVALETHVLEQRIEASNYERDISEGIVTIVYDYETAEQAEASLATHKELVVSDTLTPVYTDVTEI